VFTLDKKQFLELVQLKCSPALKRYAPQAIDMLEDLIRYERCEIASTIQFIGRLATSLVKKKEEGGGEARLSFKLTPQGIVTSDIVAGKIATWVQTIREQLFGSRVAPFREIGEAIDWIMQKQEQESATWERQKRKPDSEAERDVQHAMKGIQGSRECRVELIETYLSLDYIGRDGLLTPYRILPNMDLDRLEIETVKMSRITGFTQPSLVTYILTDIKPIIPRVIVSSSQRLRCLSSGDKLEEYRVDLQIRAKDLTYEEIHDIYHRVRNDLQLTRTKPLNKTDYKIYEAVVQRGGPRKGKGTVAFWEELRVECNKNNGTKYKTWRGIKKRYQQIVTRVEKTVSG
jgi:hypothetical protein